MLGASQKRRRCEEEEGSKKVARLERALKQMDANASNLLSGCGGPSLQTAVTRQQRRKRQPGRTLRGRSVPCRAATSAVPGHVLNPLPEVKALLAVAAAHAQHERSSAASMSASMDCEGHMTGGRRSVRSACAAGCSQGAAHSDRRASS